MITAQNTRKNILTPSLLMSHICGVSKTFSGFQICIKKIFVLTGSYAGRVGSLLPTFRDAMRTPLHLNLGPIDYDYPPSSSIEPQVLILGIYLL
jgi:hypothetical protein